MSKLLVRSLLVFVATFFSINNAKALLNFDCGSFQGDLSDPNMINSLQNATQINERSFFKDVNDDMPSIILDNELDYFQFTASETGEYIIESVGNIDLEADLYVSLCSTEFEKVAHDRDGGISQNFRIKKSLSRGQSYYIVVKHETAGSGKYNIRVIPPSGFPANNSHDAGTITVTEFNRFYGWANPVQKNDSNLDQHENMFSSINFNYLSPVYKNNNENKTHIGVDILNNQDQNIYSIGRGVIFKKLKDCNPSTVIADDGRLLHTNRSYIFVKYKEANLEDGQEFTVVYGHTEPSFSNSCAEETEQVVVGAGDKIGTTKISGDIAHLHLGTVTKDSFDQTQWGRRGSSTLEEIYDEGWRDPLSFLEKVRGTVEPQFFKASVEMNTLKNSSEDLLDLGAYSLDPNRNLTRLEAIELISKIYSTITGNEIPASIRNSRNSNPNRLISREEFLLLIARALNNGNNPPNQANSSQYIDLPNNSADHIDFRNAILFSYNNDILTDEKSWTRINSNNVVPIYRAAKWLFAMKAKLESIRLACADTGGPVLASTNFAAALFASCVSGAGEANSSSSTDAEPSQDPNPPVVENNDNFDLSDSNRGFLPIDESVSAQIVGSYSLNAGSGTIHRYIVEPEETGFYLFELRNNLGSAMHYEVYHPSHGVFAGGKDPQGDLSHYSTPIYKQLYLEAGKQYEISLAVPNAIPILDYQIALRTPINPNDFSPLAFDTELTANISSQNAYRFNVNHLGRYLLEVYSQSEVNPVLLDSNQVIHRGTAVELGAKNKRYIHDIYQTGAYYLRLNSNVDASYRLKLIEPAARDSSNFLDDYPNNSTFETYREITNEFENATTIHGRFEKAFDQDAFIWRVHNTTKPAGIYYTQYSGDINFSVSNPHAAGQIHFLSVNNKPANSSHPNRVYYRLTNNTYHFPYVLYAGHSDSPYEPDFSGVGDYSFSINHLEENFQYETDPDMVLSYGFDLDLPSVGEKLVTDRTYKANHGQMGGGNLAKMPAFVSNGYKNGAYYFDSQSWIKVPNKSSHLASDSTSLDITEALTLEAWIKADDVQDNIFPTIITHHTGQSPGAQYQIGLDPDDKLRVCIEPHFACRSGNASIQRGSWNHIALTFDASKVKYYLNGQEDICFNHAQPLSSHGGFLMIGGTAHGLWGFKGLIDEVKIYRRALNPSEIQSSYLN